MKKIKNLSLIITLIIITLLVSSCSFKNKSEEKPLNTVNTEEKSIPDDTTLAEIQTRANSEDPMKGTYSSWNDAYCAFLRTKTGNDRYYFDLAYVTEDDIPELVFYEGTSNADVTYVYTFSDGKLLPFVYGDYSAENSMPAVCGYSGTLSYKEKGNVLYIKNISLGYLWEVSYETKGNSMHHLNSLESDSLNDEDNPLFLFGEDKEVITQEDYNAKRTEYGYSEDNYQFTDAIYSEGNKITAENITQLQKEGIS